MKPRVRTLSQRAARSLRQRVAVQRGRRAFPVGGEIPYRWIGTSYGGWSLPYGTLPADAVCYLAGVGEDVSFDLALIEATGCDVHAFDPVPESLAFAMNVAREQPKWHFHPYGLWSEDTTLRFADNPIDGFVSRSATDMHGVSTGLELAVRSLPTVLAELGHDHIDFLKLSVEGSEYELIGALIASGIPIETVCVEFAQPETLQRVRGGVQALTAAGYELVDFSIRPFNWRATFRLRGAAEPAPPASAGSATQGRSRGGTA